MAKASESTDLVQIQSVDEMIAAVTSGALPDIEDPEQAAQQIVERILSTDSADDVLGNSTATAAQDVLGRPFMLHSVKLMRSSLPNSFGVFAVLDAEFADDGSREAVTCGGRTVMAQAVQLYRLDALPRAVKIVKAERATANGFYPLWLEAA